MIQENVYDLELKIKIIMEYIVLEREYSFFIKWWKMFKYGSNGCY